MFSYLKLCRLLINLLLKSYLSRVVCGIHDLGIGGRDNLVSERGSVEPETRVVGD